MSLADVQRLIRLPGRFIASPTDTSAAFPYGGTPLGYHSGGFFVPRRTYRPVRAQEWGRIVTKVIVGEDFLLGAVMRGFDPDEMALSFGAATSGVISPTGEPYAAAATRMGTYVADVPILHVPRDVTAPCVYFKRALPEIDAAARVNMQITEEVARAVVFSAGATAAGDKPCWQIGVLEDLNL